MFHALQTSVGQAVLHRLVLLVNHVLASEPVAAERLKAHAGRHVRLEARRWPSLLPALPVLAFDVTPAGLLEWRGAEDAATLPTPDLHVSVDASNPALNMLKGLSGERPAVEITGDARFAADVSWLMDNLRWDLEDDLARVIGQVPAREAARVGRAVAAALRTVGTRLGGLAARAGGTPT